VASIVLAGGEGTRLYPLTQSRCKPAVSFGGRYRLIDVPISNSINSKIHKLYVISQFFASDLHQHILESFPAELFHKGEIQLLSPEETSHGKIWYKGTADAIRKNLEYISKSSAEYFLILSGDQLYTTNYASMIALAKESGADLVIATLSVEEPEAKRMGLMKVDSKGKIEDFYEKPSTPELLKKFELSQKGSSPRYLGSMGIYVFKREALFSLLQEDGDDFGKNLIPIQMKKGKTFAFVFDGYWEDIGTIASYYEANLALIHQNKCLNIYDETFPIYTTPHLLPNPIIHHTVIHDALIGQGAIIEAQEITNSVIGLRAQIKKNTIIRNSIIIGHKFYRPPPHQSPPLPAHFFIGEGCLIEKAIIDEHSLIGNGVKLQNLKKLQKFDGNGIFIRDGIIIVASGAHIPDGFSL
jgi:glucose-1-phosphate adenylyltransferase